MESNIVNNTVSNTGNTTLSNTGNTTLSNTENTGIIKIPFTNEIVELSQPRSFFSYVNEFVFEAIEISIILYVVYIFQERELNFHNILKTSFIISGIMMAVEVYNEDMKKTIKVGIFGSLGGKMLR
jgi:hypothetical protein